MRFLLLTVLGSTVLLNCHLYSQENSKVWLRSSINISLGTGYDDYLNQVNVNRETFVSKIKAPSNLADVDLSKYEIYQDAGGNVIPPFFNGNGSFDFLAATISFIQFDEKSKQFKNDKELQIGLTLAQGFHRGVPYQLKEVPDTFPIYNRYLFYDEWMTTVGIPVQFLVKHSFFQNHLRILYGVGAGIDISIRSGVREYISLYQTLSIDTTGLYPKQTFEDHFDINHFDTYRHLLLKGNIPIGLQWKIHERFELEAMLTHSTYFQISEWDESPLKFWDNGQSKSQRYISMGLKYYFFSLDYF